LAATGLPRRFAALIATIAVVTSVAAGCGGGDSQTATTPTRPGGGDESAAAFVKRIDQAAPEQIARLCQVAKTKGEDTAFAYFKKGYVLAFSKESLSPQAVFDEILKACG
jgi:hypothetical protein